MRNFISRVDLLTQQHARLNKEVDDMSKRRFLTARDRSNLRSMKIRKLRLKDAINSLLKEGS